MNLQQTADEPTPAVVFRDGLGDRVRAAGQTLEVLLLRPEFMEVAAFEFALRERAARVTAFCDPSFAPIVRVERLAPYVHALAIESARVDGRRLSAVLAEVEAGREPLSFETAAGLLRQLVAAVARLHAHAREVGHGALAPERIILGADGRLVVVEHVLAGALEQLQWPRRRLWRELRVAMPAAAGLPRFDQRADLAQVGAVALALFAGRPLRDEDYPEGVTAVLHEVSDRVARTVPTLATGVASWLVRALQIEGRPFGSMKEAGAALDELIAPGRRVPSPESLSLVPASAVSPERRPPPAEPRRVVPQPISHQPSTLSNRRSASSWWSVLRVTFILVALGATTLAGTVRYLNSATATAETGMRSPRVVAAATRKPARPGAKSADRAKSGAVLIDAELLDAAGSAPVVPEPGWIVVAAPVEMEITERGRAIGVTRAGRLEVAPGWHELEIVNTTLGFRETRHLRVESGGTTPLEIHLPFGVVDLNATPWAEVWLNGERLGETPIGGLSLPIGPHEFVFRHPDLGERRQAVSIKVGESVRLSVDLRRQ